MGRPSRPASPPPSHAELVQRAGSWLRARGCSVVLLEPFSVRSHEQPDALGFRLGWWSIAIECKTSRSDFLRDKTKIVRINDISVGQERYYLTPPKLLKPTELPEGWGLLEVHPTIVRVVKRPYPNRHERPPFNPQRSSYELLLLVEQLERWVVGRSVSFFPPLVSPVTAAAAASALAAAAAEIAPSAIAAAETSAVAASATEAAAEEVTAIAAAGRGG